MLVGLQIGAGMGTGIPATEITVADSSYVSGDPDLTGLDIAAGDILVIIGYHRGAGSPSVGSPSGWTPIASDVSSLPDVAMFTKIADGTETGTVEALTGSSGVNDGATIVYRPDVTAKSITVQNGQAEGTSGDPTAQVTNNTTFLSPQLVVGSAHDGGGVATLNVTGASDGETSLGGGETKVARKYYASSPAAITYDMADLGSANALASGVLELTF